jgi:hypothetical protein
MKGASSTCRWGWWWHYGVDTVEGQGGVEEQKPNDPEGQMPRQLAPVAQACQEIWSYAQKKGIAKQQFQETLGEEINVCQRNGTITWKVIKESESDVKKDGMDLGDQGMNLYECSHGKVFVNSFCNLPLDWN